MMAITSLLEHEHLERIHMTQPIEIKLPNGLIICMMPLDKPTSIVGKVTGQAQPQGETQDQLWMRFINALSTTDLAALCKVYASAMPPRLKPEAVNVPRPAFTPPTEVKK
jgi:hypothetical protein